MILVSMTTFCVLVNIQVRKSIITSPICARQQLAHPPGRFRSLFAACHGLTIVHTKAVPFLNFVLDLFIFILCVRVLPEHMYVHYLCPWCLSVIRHRNWIPWNWSY